MMVFHKPNDKRIIAIRGYSKQYRIALCISGEVRIDKKNNVEDFIRTIVLPFGNSIDIFLHCSFRSRDRNEYLKSFRRLGYEPKVIIEKNYEKETDIHEIVFGRIYELHEAMKEYQIRTQSVYDIIIRIRPDVILSSLIEEYDLQKAYYNNVLCGNMLLSTFYVLNSISFISDTFFFANPQVMDQVVNIYELIRDKKISSSCTNPEALLYNYLKLNNIVIHYMKCEICLSDYSLDISNHKTFIKMLKKVRDFPIIDIRKCFIY